MRCEVASNRDKDMPPRFRVPPFAELTHPGVEHLKGMYACVLAQQSMRQGGNDQIRRMAQREMARHKIRGRVDLVLPIEGIQQGGPDFLIVEGIDSSRSSPRAGNRAG